jgi:hypothetical protein
MKQDVIILKIKCTSETCEELREEGLFFQAIADALDIDRNDIEEIDIENLNEIIEDNNND